MGKAIVMSNDHGEFDEACTESKTTSTVGNFAHGSRETPATSVSCKEADRSEKGARPQVRHGRYRGVTQFHSTEEAGEQMSGNERSNTGQSDRSNRMLWGFLLARAVILAIHDGLADRIELILPG